jgi:formate hydrogenlyase transcriptional activator
MSKSGEERRRSPATDLDEQRGTEDRIQLIIDTTPALLHSAVPEGSLDYMNQRWLTFLGVPLEEVLGWHWTRFIHAEDREAFVAKWREALATGEPFEAESRVRRADGQYRWVLHRKVPLRDASGTIVKWYGSSIDIEDRRQAECRIRELRQSLDFTPQHLEAQLQATLNVIPAYTWYAPPSGALTFVNERCADYLGLPKDHPLRFGIDTGAAWDSHIAFLHPDDREDSRRFWSTCLRTGSAGGNNFRARSAAGVYRWFLSRVEPLRAKDGTLLCWVGINLDIEELKQAEFYLAEGQRLGHTGSWAFNAAGFDYWSSELFAIHGLAPGGKAPTIAEYMALVHVEDRGFVAQEIQRMLSDHRGCDFTKRIVRPDGNVRYVRWVGVPVIESGRLKTILGTAMDVTEHELLTGELRRREAVLAEAQTLSRTGSFGWRPDSGEVVWSAETYRIFGYDEAMKPTIESVVQRVHPEDRVEFQRVVDAASRHAASHFEHTYRLLLPDGRVKHVHALARRIGDAFESHEFVGAVTDVTEHKLAEDALRESEEKFRLVVDHIDAQVTAVAANTPDGDVELVNQRVLDYFGKTLEELKSWRTSDAVHPDDRSRVIAAWKTSIETGQPYEADYRVRRSDGVYRWFHTHARALRGADGAIVRWYVTGTDIDDRKRAEERVRQDERELRAIVDFLPELLVVGDAQGGLVYANRAALDFTGRTLDETLGRPDIWTEIIHPDDLHTVQAAIGGLAEGIRSEVEFRLRRSDGQYRWMLGRGAPLRDDEGRVIGWFSTGTDIDDRKRAEQRMRDENVALREEVDKASMFEEIVGTSPALRAVLTSVAQVAPTDSTVLITGETGTGKELVARAIHKRSPRASRAFVSVNCAAIPPTLIASELFGHEKGAFTGALERRAGRFEQADGGTIFLDEVGDLPPDTQLALLRVLQEREFERVGSARPIKVDVRVIAATNRDLDAAIAGDAFRTDLFYRLNVFPIEVPPLRERPSDIALLVAYFVERYARNAGKTIRQVDKRTLELVQSYRWPGNIRELQNVVERAVIICESETLTVDPHWLGRQTPPARRGPLANELAERERQMIETALAESKGRVSGPTGAAARLGMPGSTLESKIRALGIRKHRFKAS